MRKNTTKPKNSGSFIAKAPYLETEKKTTAKKVKGGDLRSKGGKK